MTVSDNIPARAYGYKTKVRLAGRQKSVMGPLAGCRGNLINYTSILRGMDLEKRKQMFGSYPFMPGWFKELGRLTERISKVSDSVG